VDAPARAGIAAIQSAAASIDEPAIPRIRAMLARGATRRKGGAQALRLPASGNQPPLKSQGDRGIQPALRPRATRYEPPPIASIRAPAVGAPSIRSPRVSGSGWYSCRVVSSLSMTIL
jgi:hypothetical protein